jgi:hypothetical protein
MDTSPSAAEAASNSRSIRCECGHIFPLFDKHRLCFSCGLACIKANPCRTCVQWSDAEWYTHSETKNAWLMTRESVLRQKLNVANKHGAGKRSILEALLGTDNQQDGEEDHSAAKIKKLEAFIEMMLNNPDADFSNDAAMCMEQPRISYSQQLVNLTQETLRLNGLISSDSLEPTDIMTTQPLR